MSGTSGFQEVQSSPPDHHRIHVLHKQRRQFGTGSWHLLRTHPTISALSPQASAQNGKRFLTPFSCPGWGK